VLVGGRRRLAGRRPRLRRREPLRSPGRRGRAFDLRRAGEGREQVLGEHDPVVAEHVVRVELAGGDELHLGEVAEAERRRGIVATDDHQHTTVDAEPASAATAALVLGESKPHASTTTTLPSLARSDSAERRASEIIFFGVFCWYDRGFGPRATPPPLKCGERVEPWRALPVPFWRYGLAPPPLTSERVLVLWVPARRAASWAVTTWCMTGTFGWMPNTASSRSTVPASLPAAFLRVICAIAITLPSGRA
jgi:hypothetical protein